MNIYVFGNSHANVFTKTEPAFQGKTDRKDEMFKSYCVRFLSATNIDWKTLIDFLSGFNKSSDYVILAVGEHDCRMEINDCILLNLSWKESLHTYIDKFVTDVLLKLKNDGYDVIGWGSHPSVNLVFSIEWDSYMGQKCKEIGIPFISIMSYLVKTDCNLLNKKYYMDDLHLNPETILPIIEDQIKNLNLTKKEPVA